MPAKPKPASAPAAKQPVLQQPDLEQGIEQMFAALDKDKDEAIDFREFLGFCPASIENQRAAGSGQVTAGYRLVPWVAGQDWKFFGEAT